MVHCLLHALEVLLVLTFNKNLHNVEGLHSAIAATDCGFMIAQGTCVAGHFQPGPMLFCLGRGNADGHAPPVQVQRRSAATAHCTNRFAARSPTCICGCARMSRHATRGECALTWPVTTRAVLLTDKSCPAEWNKGSLRFLITAVPPKSRASSNATRMCAYHEWILAVLWLGPKLRRCSAIVTHTVAVEAWCFTNEVLSSPGMPWHSHEPEKNAAVQKKKWSFCAAR